VQNSEMWIDISLLYVATHPLNYTASQTGHCDLNTTLRTFAYLTEGESVQKKSDIIFL